MENKFYEKALMDHYYNVWLHIRSVDLAMDVVVLLILNLNTENIFH